MKRNFLTTSLLAMSLLSLNLSALEHEKCSGGVCMVDLSSIAPKVKEEVKRTLVPTESHEMVVNDNIDTIILPHSKYVMSENEIEEYDLAQMKIQNSLLAPALNLENLPSSENPCEEYLKAVEIMGFEDTYECT